MVKVELIISHFSFSDLLVISQLFSNIFSRCTFCGQPLPFVIPCYYSRWKWLSIHLSRTDSFVVYQIENSSVFIGTDHSKCICIDKNVYYDILVIRSNLCVLWIEWVHRISIRQDQHFPWMRLVFIPSWGTKEFGTDHPFHTTIGCFQGIWKYSIYEGIIQNGDWIQNSNWIDV